MIRHHEPVCQHLQGIEIGKNLYVGIGNLPFNRVGKAEEQRITRGKNHNGLFYLGILCKDLTQRNRDINPLGILGNKLFH